MAEISIDQDQPSISTIIACVLLVWILLVWGWIASFPGTEMSTWANALGAFLSAPIVVCIVAIVTVFAFETRSRGKGVYLEWQDIVSIGILAVVTILLPSIFSHVSILLEVKQGNLARQLWDFRFWSLPSAVMVLGSVAIMRECSRP